jgi:hypothetical protein
MLSYLIGRTDLYVFIRESRATSGHHVSGVKSNTQNLFTACLALDHAWLTVRMPPGKPFSHKNRSYGQFVIKIARHLGHLPPLMLVCNATLQFAPALA